MRSLVAQYLQLVDPSSLPIPDNVSNQTVQEAIAQHMFNGSLLPPPSYQTRVLKRILTRIEETSGPEDEIIEPLLNTFTTLLSHPKPDPIQQAQELAYVTYTVPDPAATPDSDNDNDKSLAADADAGPRKTVLTTESRSLLLSSGTTGRRTWEAALHMGTYLSTREGGDIVRGKRVVELGAGTGFLSLFAAKWLPVESVVVTDCEDGLVGNTAGCIKLNGLDRSATATGTEKIIPRIWRWGESLSLDDAGARGGRFDVALGADLIYDTDLIPPLLSTVNDLFDNYGLKVFIISATVRNEETFDAFLNACESNRFVAERVSFESPPEQEQSGFFHSTAVPIRTYRISR